MDYAAFIEAGKRLRRAEDAANALSMLDRYEPFTDAWSALLTAASTFYSKLEQGSKTTDASRRWFAGKKQERRLDPLLQYIHQARNAEEHGVQPIVLVSMDVNMGFPFGMVTISGNGDFDPVAGKAPLPPRRFALQTVVNSKYGDRFDPPTTHQGQPIGNDPIVAANLTVTYLRIMLAEAEGLLSNAPPPLPPLS